MTQSSCKRDTKLKSHPGMKLVVLQVSRVNTRLFNPRLGLAAAYPDRGVLGWASES